MNKKDKGLYKKKYFSDYFKSYGFYIHEIKNFYSELFRKYFMEEFKKSNKTIDKFDKIIFFDLKEYLFSDSLIKEIKDIDKEKINLYD